MLARFCLYGFLKNQQYFEPFLVLILLDRGLSFFAIGCLLAVQSIATNALELLSGALADTWGRRRSMVASMASYLLSFSVFAFARSPLMLGVAMALYGAGDAFRSGTHKAMIFAWLKSQGREDERTRVYGLTRSWSKIGSALAVALGAGWVVATGDMDQLFLLAIPVYVVGLLNLATYPATLEGGARGEFSIRAMLRHLRETLGDVWRSAPLRGLVTESSAFMGVFSSTKGYLQPVLQTLAATGLVTAFGVTQELDDVQSTALLVGPVYIVLFLASATMSRRAHRLVSAAGSEERAALWLWAGYAAMFAVITLGGAASWGLLAVVGFLLLHAVEAVWRPVAISRFDEHGTEEQGATLLSIESQARTLTTAVVAPVVGLVVDAVVNGGGSASLPVGVVGLLVGAFFVARGVRSRG